MKISKMNHRFNAELWSRKQMPTLGLLAQFTNSATFSSHSEVKQIAFFILSG